MRSITSILSLSLLACAAVFLASCATRPEQTKGAEQLTRDNGNRGKPAYQVSYLPEKKLIGIALHKLKETGLDSKYDTERPFVLWTPSQMGDEFVGYALAAQRPNKEGYVEIRCLVEVNSIFGRVGSVRELPGRDGRRWFVHVDETGKVTAVRMEESQE